MAFDLYSLLRAIEEAEMKVVRVVTAVALVLVVAGLVLATGCGSQGPRGATGAQGPKGDTGAQGPAGFGWGNSTSYGPYVRSIPAGVITESIPNLNPGDRVSYNFTATGGSVYYWVCDPNENTVLIGNGEQNVSGQADMSGQGAFIAAVSGTYSLIFKSATDTPSVLVINYTVYPVQ